MVTSRRMTLLMIRTLVFFVAALVVASWFGWSWVSGFAVILTGAATAIQAVGAVWLRRTEQATSPTSGASTEKM